MKEPAADGVAVKWWVVVVMAVSIVAWWCWRFIRRLLDRGPMPPSWSIGFFVVGAVGAAFVLWGVVGGGEELGQTPPMAPVADCEVNACEPRRPLPEGDSMTGLPGGFKLDAEDSATVVADTRLAMLANMARFWSDIERISRGDFFVLCMDSECFEASEDHLLVMALARYVEFELFVHMPELFDELGRDQ